MIHPPPQDKQHGQPCYLVILYAGGTEQMIEAPFTDHAEADRFYNWMRQGRPDIVDRRIRPAEGR